MTDLERLAGLQTKLVNVSSEAANTRAGLANHLKALSDEEIQAVIDGRKPATEKLRKAVDAAELQLRETEERFALLSKAISRLQDRIRATAEEVATQQIQALQQRIRPTLARYNALIDELAIVSHDLLTQVQTDEAYGHIANFLGNFLFPARTGQTDNTTECAFRARILGDVANLATKIEPKRLQKVG